MQVLIDEVCRYIEDNRCVEEHDECHGCHRDASGAGCMVQGTMVCFARRKNEWLLFSLLRCDIHC